MIRQDLVMVTRTGVQDFAPNTSVQVNKPNAFTNGGLFERAQSFKNLAAVGLVGFAGKRVFDAYTDGFAQRTGRTDLQRSINRSKKNIGTITSLAGAFILGGATLGAAATFKFAVDEVIETVERTQEMERDQKNAEFRQRERGAIRDRSRSGV